MGRVVAEIRGGSVLWHGVKKQNHAVIDLLGMESHFQNM